MIIGNIITLDLAAVGRDLWKFGPVLSAELVVRLTAAMITLHGV
jgi:hypothetical protein